MKRRLVIIALILLGGTAALAAVSSRREKESAPPSEAPATLRPTTTTPPEPPPAATGVLALRPGDASAADLSRFGVVILNAWDHERIPGIKRANPGAVVLVYKDMASTRGYAVHGGVDEELLPTGVGFAAAERDHPEWFLLDQRRRRIEWRGYDDHWWMDVGNAEYVAAWTTAVATEVERNGWDGVLIDNAMTSTSFYRRPGVEIPRYPDDDAYRAATEGFLGVAAGRLRGAGHLVVANMGGQTPSIDLVSSWAAITGGIMREHFGRWGFDGRGDVIVGAEWSHQLEQQEAVNRAGAFYLAVSYADPDDEGFVAYARASFLIGWDGTADAQVITAPSAGVDPFRRSWAVDIGSPVEARSAVGASWVRRYSGGIAVANPGPAPATVDLGGVYETRDGPVTTVTLEPGTGAILSRASEATPDRSGNKKVRQGTAR